jgi:hypothetical protein
MDLKRGDHQHRNIFADITFSMLNVDDGFKRFPPVRELGQIAHRPIFDNFLDILGLAVKRQTNNFSAGTILRINLVASIPTPGRISIITTSGQSCFDFQSLLLALTDCNQSETGVMF